MAPEETCARSSKLGIGKADRWRSHNVGASTQMMETGEGGVTDAWERKPRTAVRTRQPDGSPRMIYEKPVTQKMVCAYESEEAKLAARMPFRR